MHSERYKLLDLVRSPYFNKNEKVIAFAQLLLEENWLDEEAKLEKEKLYKALYPNETYKEQRIADLQSYLLKLVEKYLALDIYHADTRRIELDTIKGFRTKQLNKHFEQAHRKLKKNDKLELQFIDEYHLDTYYLEKESDLYFSSKDSRTKDKSIERQTFQLDLFYLTAKLRNCCEMLNRQNIVQEEYDIHFLEEVQQMVNNHPEKLAGFPAIPIYNCILMTLKDSKNEAHYNKLTNLLTTHQDKLPDTETRLMFDFAQNYCIKQINSGNSNYLRELFRLFQLLLQNGLMLDDGQISEWDYKNIVTVGGRLKEHGWIEQFVHDYKDKLPEDDRENAFTYNLASTYYSQGRHQEAMRLLLSVEFTDLYYSLGSRSLLLKIYFELDETEPLFSLCDAFKIYLKRNKLVSSYQYTAHFNLVKFTKRLATLRNRMYSMRSETFLRDLGKLRKRMEVATAISNSNWLLGEVDKLAEEVVV